MENKAFCEECLDEVGFTVREAEMTAVLKGKEYKYIGKEAVCSECGGLLYVPEINDENLEILYNVYREENGIVSLEKVRAIPEKYGIGKRPLSVLLGWGEHTFSRYYDGDVPTRQYSEMLEKIYDEPEYYREILEKGKEKLKSVSAYEKSKKAVDFIIGENKAETNKNSAIEKAISFVLCRCGDITHLALQKTLYYIQGFYYAFYNEYIFEEDCEAWVHGPVYRDIYFKYREYRFDPIQQNVSFDETVLTAAEKAVFESIEDNICCYSGKVLEKFTHNETPWIEARGSLSENEASENIIQKEAIGKYFSEIKEKYHMVKPNDIRYYTEEMFRSI